jgi:hypothetical protein
MFWFAFAASSVLLAYAIVRARRLGPLFADEHLTEVAALLPDLKRRALAGREDDPASLRTAMLAVGYTIRRDEGAWVHHVSVSSPVSPARAAGTFFLGLVRGVLGLEGAPAEALVSPDQVFHLIARLSDEEQETFAERAVAVAAPTELRGIAIAGRAVLLPRLVERALPPGGGLVKKER